MNVFEIVAYDCRSRHYLAEGWQTLTESQKKVINECERELWPLMEELVTLFESRLKPESIEKLFSAAEEISMGKKTRVGKAAGVGKETIQKINQKLNELGKKLQDTEPVKNLDAQVEKLKQEIKQKAGDDSKIIQQVEKYGDWAKENPGKSAFVIGVLTAAAAFAGGPAGGAAAGFLLRSANELLKGESASSAAGKATKTAAIGGLVGAGLDAVGDAIAGSLEASAVDNFPDLKSSELSYSRQGTGIPETFLNAEVYGRPEDVDFVVDKFNSAVDAMQSEDFSEFEDQWIEMQAKIDEMNQLEYMEDVVADSEAAAEFLDSVDTFRQFSDAIAATAQTAAQEASAKSESIHEDLKSKIKGAAGNVKKQATQAVTKQKLMKAWQKQGKPLDYGSIIKIMQSAGLDKNEIEKVSQSAKVELPTKSQDKDIEAGRTLRGSDGDSYNWKGAQWVNNKTGKVAKKSVAQELTKTAKSTSKTNSSNAVSSDSTPSTVNIDALAKEIKKRGMSDDIRKLLST